MIGAPELAGRLGLRKTNRDWRGDCPACGYHASFIVRQGRHGGALVRCVSCEDRESIGAALDRVTAGEWIKSDRQEPETDIEARARKMERARVLWAGAGAVPGTPAELYLWNRCLGFLSGCSRLRYREDVSHPEGGRHPAMIGLVTNADDQPIAVHRTYLDRATGRKAGLEPAKASLGPVWGGAIRLSVQGRRSDLVDNIHEVERPAGTVDNIHSSSPLIIAEGIETAASAGLMEDAPAWAAISAGNLASGLILPAEARWVIVAADPDPPGIRAAEQAATRWRREGRRVEIIRPHGTGDFNDMLMREGGHG